MKECNGVYGVYVDLCMKCIDRLNLTEEFQNDPRTNLRMLRDKGILRGIRGIPKDIWNSYQERKLSKRRKKSKRLFFEIPTKKTDPNEKHV